MSNTTSLEDATQPVDDSLCHAFTAKNGEYTGLYRFEDMRQDMRNAGSVACRKKSRFRVGEYVSCADHLSYMVITASPDWDGNMIAVEILR
jgi:hypothetical protein